MSVIIHGDIVEGSIVILGNQPPIYVFIQENIKTKDQLFDRIRAKVVQLNLTNKSRMKIDNEINLLESMFDKEVA